MGEVLLWAVVIGLLPAFIAHKKGRSFVKWWIMGAALFIVAFPVSLFLSTNQAELDRRKIATGDFKKCHQCAEPIRSEAIVCPHCRGET